MNTPFKSLVLCCLALSFLSGCGGSGFTPAEQFTPAERAEVEKYIKQGGRKALLYYMRENNHGDANRIHKYITFLVSQGADVNVKDDRDYDGVTPLHFAAERGNIETVKFLVSKGADVNAKNRYSHTPLHWAARNRNAETIKFLVSKGSDVNAIGIDGTPLYLAAERGNAEIVKFLVSKGANVNVTGGYDSFDATPLHWAARGGNIDLVKFLVSKGADINAKSREGHGGYIINGHIASDGTPLDWAKWAEKKAVVEYLSPLTKQKENPTRIKKAVVEYLSPSN